MNRKKNVFLWRKLPVFWLMCDVIKICLKRRDATRSGKENQPLNIETPVSGQF